MAWRMVSGILGHTISSDVFWVNVSHVLQLGVEYVMRSKWNFTVSHIH
jgi:hypothetical protein